MGNTMNVGDSNDNGGKPVQVDPRFKKELKLYLGGKKYKDRSTKTVTLKHLFEEKEKLQLDTPYDDDGNTALMLALKTQESDVIMYILHNTIKVGTAIDRSPVDVTKINKNNQNALMFALMNDDRPVAKQIFNRIPQDKLKETLNLQDVNGNTALMMYVQYRYGDLFFSYFEKETDDLIYDFINAGADLNLKNKEGKTALDIAIEKNIPKFQEILRNNSAPPQTDGECWSAKSHKSKRKGKKMDGRKKKSGNRKKSSKNKSRK